MQRRTTERKVTDILVKLLGPEVSISSTQVSRAAEQLDAGLAAWRERPLDETPYLFLDARYERVREAGLDPRDGTVVGMAIETGCRFHRSVGFPDMVHAGILPHHPKVTFQGLLNRVLTKKEISQVIDEVYRH